MYAFVMIANGDSDIPVIKGSVFSLPPADGAGGSVKTFEIIVNSPLAPRSAYSELTFRRLGTRDASLARAHCSKLYVLLICVT